MNLEITKEQCRQTAAFIRERTVGLARCVLAAEEPDAATLLHTMRSGAEMLEIALKLEQAAQRDGSAAEAGAPDGPDPKKKRGRPKRTETAEPGEKPEDAEGKAAEWKLKRRALVMLQDVREKVGSGAYGAIAERSGVGVDIIISMMNGNIVPIQAWRAVHDALEKMKEEQADGE